VNPTPSSKNLFSHKSQFDNPFTLDPYTINMAQPAVPSLKLNSGHSMPQVGFGLWKVTNATCADTVYNAIKAGYRLFDGACGKRHLRGTRIGLTYSKITVTRKRLAKV
jgi:hypothetical protein